MHSRVTITGTAGNDHEFDVWFYEPHRDADYEIDEIEIMHNGNRRSIDADKLSDEHYNMILEYLHGNF